MNISSDTYEDFKLHDSPTYTNFLCNFDIKNAELKKLADILKIKIKNKENNLDDRTLDSLLLEKGNMAKIKRLGIESMLRAKNADKLTRWEQYRNHKVELVGRYIALLKEHRRIKTWVSIVQGQAMLV